MPDIASSSLITAPQPVLAGMLAEIVVFVHIEECVSALCFVSR
jgi:hypothetical protein